MSDAQKEAKRRYGNWVCDREAFVAGAEWQRTREVTYSMLERALDAYTERVIDISDGLSASKRRAEAMYAALEAARNVQG